jgi:hypothetical protein
MSAAKAKADKADLARSAARAKADVVDTNSNRADADVAGRESTAAAAVAVSSVTTTPPSTVHHASQPMSSHQRRQLAIANAFSQICATDTTCHATTPIVLVVENRLRAAPPSPSGAPDSAFFLGRTKERLMNAQR